MNANTEAPLLTAPTFDMAQSGDTIGLTRAFTPARTIEGVAYWRPVASVEALPGDRFRVYVEGEAATFPMTMGRAVPVVLRRPTHRHVAPDVVTATDCEARGYAHDFVTPDDETRTECIACGGSWSVRA